MSDLDEEEVEATKNLPCNKHDYNYMSDKLICELDKSNEEIENE